MANNAFAVEYYRWYEDDNVDCDAVTQVSGSGEGGSGDKEILDRQTGTSNGFHLRIHGYETTGGTKSALLQLEYNHEGGGWNDVATGSGPIRVFTGSGLTDTTPNTARLTITGGTGGWTDGDADIADAIASFTMTKDCYTSIMFALYIDNGSVSDGDSILLRLRNNGGGTDPTNLGAGSEIEVTVDKPAAQSLAHIRHRNWGARYIVPVI